VIICNKHKFIYFFPVGGTATRSVNLRLLHLHDDQDIKASLKWLQKKNGTYQPSRVQLNAKKEVARIIHFNSQLHNTIQNYQKITKNPKFVVSREITPRWLKLIFSHLGRLQDFESFKKIATVRNPYSLFAGSIKKNQGWMEQKSPPWDIQTVQAEIQNFSGYKHKIPARIHGHDLIDMNNGQTGAYSCFLNHQYLLNEHMRFENLEDDLFAQLQVDAKIPNVRNKSSAPIKVEEAFTKEAIRFINLTYGPDFDKYDYEKVDPK
jgi:hypothetical protein